MPRNPSTITQRPKLNKKRYKIALELHFNSLKIHFLCVVFIHVQFLHFLEIIFLSLTLCWIKCLLFPL